MNLKFLYNIDFFGNEPKLYYKGKLKRKTCIGFFSTIIYIIIYIYLFIHKLRIIIKKIDCNCYETSTYTNETTSIQLSKENIYGAFALINPFTRKEFINESIYYLEAIFNKAKRVNGILSWESKKLELEVCKLENFGSKYKKIFQNDSLNNLYCIKN